MHSTLIIGRMEPQFSTEVARLFGAFDQTDMPNRMGTRRRELFTFNGLYVHLQDFAGNHGQSNIQQARSDPRFVQISADLKPYIEAYDPATWRSPADAMASRFYHWEPPR
jgi:cyclase